MAVKPAIGLRSVNTSRGDIQNGWQDECNIITCAGTCCTKHNCCPILNAECCPTDGCCDLLETCCGDGCCSFGQTCCKRGVKEWCCNKNQRCGVSYSCVNAARSLTPAFASLLTLVAIFIASKTYFM
ncbi:hypothetical protein NPIL_146161 [Nephila pilipes]|uniref:Uncharacterized protein n=1 Tax=Nephila pilipes TaxID=299642 RepID=A0A8X6NI25_NEPPI|nr:hypothetical protein NPIL_146161 [Nephila pilipes]